MSWKHVLYIGLAIGVPLAVLAYGFLWVLGQQLEAQAYSNNVEQRYAQERSNERLSIKPTNSIPIYEKPGYEPLSRSSEATGVGEQLQHTMGYRHFQPNYDPSTAEDVTFNGNRRTSNE